MSHNNSNQVAAFEKLVGICNKLGTRYNPSNASLTPSALGAMLEQVQQIAKAEDHAYVSHKLAISVRKEAYDALPGLLSRLMQSVTAQNMSAEKVRDILEMKRVLIRSHKPGKPPAVSSGETTTGPSKESTRAIATFDWITKQFSRIVDAIERMPEFKPNEADLNLEGLKAKLEDLKAKSAAVMNASINLRDARRARDAWYFGAAGIHPVGQQVKRYIRSVAGTRSDEAREVGEIKFKSKPLN